MEGEIAESFLARVQAWRGDRRVAAAVCACIAIAAGAAWWHARAAAGSPPGAAPPRASSSNTQVSAATPTTTLRVFIVDVVGAVRAPGVVHIEGGARVADAIAAAGGATTDADLTRVNLAARVNDGDRIAVPARGLPAPALDPGAVSGGTTDGTTSGPVNLNTATAAQLDALPGIGPATAAAIVSDRDTHGPFRSVSDLGRVRGIGDAKLAALRDLVTV